MRVVTINAFKTINEITFEEFGRLSTIIGKLNVCVYFCRSFFFLSLFDNKHLGHYLCRLDMRVHIIFSVHILKKKLILFIYLFIFVNVQQR